MLTVLVFAAALFVLAVLWAPRTGYGGLRTYLSRYLLSVGMPFELWMRRVAELSEANISSARFLESTIEEVAKFPWITGGEWRAPDGQRKFGTPSENVTSFRVHALDLTFHTEIHLSPAMLSTPSPVGASDRRVYEGKRREQALKENAYMQAVHETGARLTHDMKNLLQSLYALTSSRRPTRGTRSARKERVSEAMLERQLPVLANLDKLQNQKPAPHKAMIPANDCGLKSPAHAETGVEFSSNGDMRAPRCPPICLTLCWRIVWTTRAKSAKPNPAFPSACRSSLELHHHSRWKTPAPPFQAVHWTACLLRRLRNRGAEGWGLGCFRSPNRRRGWICIDAFRKPRR